MGAFVPGLGRDDLHIRGSRHWACGKCGFERNFTNRCKCLQCGQRPTQWVLDAQAARVKELAKRAPAAWPAAGGNSKPSELEREVARLRAENATLKSSSAAGQSRAKDAETAAPAAAGSEQADEDFQQQLDDLEGQAAGLRKMAKEAGDASFLNAALENIESQAAAVRMARRAGWTIPRRLDRQRARVAERAVRVEKAQERIAELQAEQARVAADLLEAAAHLQAKQEDLAAEKAEVAALEQQLPAHDRVHAEPAAATQGATAVDGPGSEQRVLDDLRRIAASKGVEWRELLSSIEAAGPGAPTTQPSQTAAAAAVDGGKAAAMDLDESQNALVPAKEKLEVSPSSGASLAVVPALGGKRSPAAASTTAPLPKVTRRG